MADDTILAVDVGGTFTDAVLTTGGKTFSGKTATTPDDQSLGVIAAARQALGAANVESSQVNRFVHGMTVTTNALLEGEFAQTALLATRGFTDLEQLGRQNRPSLYKLCVDRPTPIVPDELRLAIDERCGPDGVIEPLDDQSVRRALQCCHAAKVQSVAVCLLFSFRYPAHELHIAELAAEMLPGVHVSLSHKVVGTFREYERCATTIADAALSPLVDRYLKRLCERAKDEGLPAPDVMLSNGGSASAELAARNAASTVLSGPAGGAVGAARVAVRVGQPRALGFDMGGTSTDVSLVQDGAVHITAAREIAGRPVALPSIDILTVGAGGGSIAWRDDGGALRVGPHSAGARPGPACYGHGGTLPTVTDANLLLGRLGPQSALAGDLRLDSGAAELAVGSLAAELGLDPLTTADGIVKIAILEMSRATNAATISRGIDPRDRALVAFGGAGPMHAAAIAEDLAIRTVICPRACGVLSAYGMVIAGRRYDRSRSLVRPLSSLTDNEIDSIVNDLRKAIATEMADPPEARLQVTCELRYSGQAFELPVSTPADEAITTAALADAFNCEHQSRYGFAQRDAEIELVTVRVSLTTGGQRPYSTGSDSVTPPGVNPTLVDGNLGGGAHSTRTAWFDGDRYETRVVTGSPPDETIMGPAIFELPQATIVVPPNWSAAATAGDVILTRRPS